jgi:hypothetical protein
MSKKIKDHVLRTMRGTRHGRPLRPSRDDATASSYAFHFVQVAYSMRKGEEESSDFATTTLT